MQHSIQVNRPGHIPVLDGVRGLAILCVVLWHYMDFVHPWFPGWAGVDLFFVLSGYLITGRLMQTKGAPGYFSRFYRNRVLRIFPLYYTVVIAFFAFIRFFIQNKHLPLYAVYTQHWKSFILFTENWTFIRFGFPKDLSLTPLWSVAVEEQFYLFWPLVIFFTPSAKSRIWIFSTGILLVLLARSLAYMISGSPDHNYYNTFFRMDSLLAGSLLYQLHYLGMTISSRLLKWTAGILLVVFLSGVLFSGTPSPFTPFMATTGYTVIALLFTCLLQRAVQPSEGIIPRFFNMGFLRYLGKISYGLYLVHVPLLLIVGTKLYFWGIARWPDRTALIHWTSTTVCLLLTLLISDISYRYFESWFLNFKNKGVPKRI